MVHGSILLILLGVGLGFLGYKGSLDGPCGPGIGYGHSQQRYYHAAAFSGPL